VLAIMVQICQDQEVLVGVAMVEHMMKTQAMRVQLTLVAGVVEEVTVVAGMSKVAQEAQE